ncbi:MAG TPA: methyltransferase MtaB domain-containing protein [Atribacteraceae bacterium]|nr:methyltransferase MtaB domain-containing protein [Atribacteraceae bacterium]
MFTTLAVSQVDDLIYGVSPNALTLKNGLVIGGGTVFPEINFTLPPMEVTTETMPEVKTQYREMTKGVLDRAKALHVPGLIVEIELLPPLTMHPEWGVEVTKLVLDLMHDYQEKFGLKSSLRITPNDIREMVRPPHMAGGYLYDAMMKSFRGCAQAGAEMLAIESTGGKEIHDDALLNADLQSVLVILGILSIRDMTRLWQDIVAIARETGTVPSGDSACGFGNTAMVLAERGYIPRTFAAVVRVATVIRSLVAYEVGAVGPSKDCAYEGPYLKAITGYPISMEGRSAAVAHLSPLGNITAATADLWSNESVQNIKLLADIAPVVSMEQLVYDCRLLNAATRQGKDNALTLRNLHVESDSRLDPQAYILRPDVVIDIARNILTEKNHFLRTKRSAREALRVLRQGIDRNVVAIPSREIPWLERMAKDIESLSDDEKEAWSQVKHRLDLDKILLADYNIEK